MYERLPPPLLHALLGRGPLPIASPPKLRGQRLAVTGAAGSIGRTLVERLLGAEPEALLCIDRDEAGLVKLAGRLSPCPAAFELLDVREQSILTARLRAARIDILWHVAAVKHVPFLEHRADAALRDNVLATAAVLQAGADAEVRRIVLVSSDKAAAPVSVLGQTKRLAERLAMAYPERASAVRLANVLGSRGSVLECWLSAAHESRPVAVAGSGVSRSFITADEAVDYLLAALRAAPGALLAPLLPPPLAIETLFERALSAFPTLRAVPREPWHLVPGERAQEPIATPAELATARDAAPSGLRFLGGTMPLCAAELTRLRSAADEPSGARQAIALAIANSIDS